jgi:hypothetical protein
MFRFDRVGAALLGLQPPSGFSLQVREPGCSVSLASTVDLCLPRIAVRLPLGAATAAFRASPRLRNSAPAFKLALRVSQCGAFAAAAPGGCRFRAACARGFLSLSLGRAPALECAAGRAALSACGGRWAAAADFALPRGVGAAVGVAGGRGGPSMHCRVAAGAALLSAGASRAGVAVRGEAAGRLGAASVALAGEWRKGAAFAGRVERRGRALALAVDCRAQTYRVVAGPFRVAEGAELTLGAQGTWFVWRRFGLPDVGLRATFRRS